MGNVINIYKYFSIKENLNLEVMLLVEKKLRLVGQILLKTGDRPENCNRCTPK